MDQQRIDFINQKRTTLSTQITNLQSLFDQKKVNEANLNLRMHRVTELFHGFEELNDELSILDPSDENSAVFEDIQNKYYDLASAVQIHLNPEPERPRTESVNTTGSSENARRLKLPVADLPRFDGRYEAWLSYKNTFLSMIDARDDISDLEKFLYLKSSLRGDALNKIAIYHASEENYKNAWDVLYKTYEKKRILKSRHLSAIIKRPALTKVTPESIRKLVSEMQQHVSILDSLGVKIGPEIEYQLLEEKLPRELVDKWEDKLPSNYDDFPTFSDLCDFLTETAFRLSKHERDETTSQRTDLRSKRHRSGKEYQNSKSQRIEGSARAFATYHSNNCLVCKSSTHSLYRCQAFQKLSIPRRRAVVKKAALCENCLRFHRGDCQAGSCRLCTKKHNTLLHETDSDAKESLAIPSTSFAAGSS